MLSLRVSGLFCTIPWHSYVSVYCLLKEGQGCSLELASLLDYDYGMQTIYPSMEHDCIKVRRFLKHSTVDCDFPQNMMKIQLEWFAVNPPCGANHNVPPQFAETVAWLAAASQTSTANHQQHP
jgi:hypothetical protein